MSHLSGYAGSITFVGASGVTIFAPAVTDLKVTQWTVDQETDTFEARAKGDAWVTTFATASRWRGEATFLLQSGIELAGDSMEIRDAAVAAAVKTIDVALVAESGTEYTGTGLVTAMRSNCPIDGPIEHVVTFAGNTFDLQFDNAA